MKKTTVEVLCRRDATILTAETALKFLVQSLEKQDLLTGKKLANSLKNRIKQRRLYQVVGALQYLHNPNQFLEGTEEDEGSFKKATYEEVKNVICEVAAMSKDSCSTLTTGMDSSSETVCDSDAEPSPPSYEAQLNRQINLATVATLSSDQQPLPSTSAIRTDIDLKSLIHVEMALFENGGRRGEILKEVFEGCWLFLRQAWNQKEPFPLLGFSAIN